MDQPGLGHRIGDGRPGRVQPGNRGDIHHPPPPLRLHHRRHRLDHLHRPGQVHRDNLVPRLHGQPVQIGERDRLVIRCIVDQNIQPAEPRHHIAHKCGDCRPIGNIAGKRRRLDLVPRRELSGDPFGLLPALRVHHRDMHAFPRQSVANPLPQPAITAGDQRHRPVQIHPFAPASGGRMGPAMAWMQLPPQPG